MLEASLALASRSAGNRRPGIVNDRAWGLDDLRALVEGSPATIEPDALFAAVRAAARPGPLEDDASIVAVTLLSS